MKEGKGVKKTVETKGKGKEGEKKGE